MNDVNMQEIGCRCSAYLYRKNKIYVGTMVPAIKFSFESHITCIISSTEHFLSTFKSRYIYPCTIVMVYNICFFKELHVPISDIFYSICFMQIG